MMNIFRRPELVEKIILEPRVSAWIALSVGGCGILARTLIGRHMREYGESRKIALKFAHHVLQKIIFSPQNPSSTPQVLVTTADEVIDDPEHVYLSCTTWRHLLDEIEICSVGANSVLVFENDDIWEAIIPHTINTLLQSRGEPPASDPKGHIETHGLGGKDGCNVEDVGIAHIPLRLTTTVAIIQDRRLADAIIQSAVQQSDLSSFIERWTPPGKRIRTSVLLSL
jgi:hypothetical protein